MRCDTLKYDYPDFARNACSAETRVEIERHLHTCPSCAGMVADLTRLFALLDADRAADRGMPDIARFGVEINNRIDARTRRVAWPSAKIVRLLVPLGAAVCIVMVLLAIPPRPEVVHQPILTQEMHAVITSLDTADIASLNNAYIDPVTSPGAFIPNGTASSAAYADSDIDAGIVFDGVSYTDLLSASFDYLDQSTVIELLPADRSQQLLDRGSDIGHL